MMDKYVEKLTRRYKGLDEEECRNILGKFIHLPICLLNCLKTIYAHATSDLMTVTNGGFEMTPWTTELRLLNFLCDQQPDKDYCSHSSCISRCLTNGTLFQRFVTFVKNLVQEHKEEYIEKIHQRLAEGETLVFKDYAAEQAFLNLSPAEKLAREFYYTMDLTMYEHNTHEDIIQRHAEIAAVNGKGIFPPPRKLWHWQSKTYHIEFNDFVRYDMYDKIVD